jgi:hypothetical protein
VEHRKSFSELTQAEVHPATSASAPEGFLTSEANPNGATDGAKNSGETNKLDDNILVEPFSHCVLDPDRYFSERRRRGDTATNLFSSRSPIVYGKAT